MTLIATFAARHANYPTPWGFNGLGEVTYLRTYARTKPDGTLECWPETVQRVLLGVQEIGAGLSEDELERLGLYMLDLKCAVMSRGLWVFGTDMVRLYGAAALLNCYVTVLEQPSDFVWLMNQLMVGGGVGFSVLPSNTERLGTVSGAAVAHTAARGADVYVVPDTRQGWANCVGLAIEAVLSGRSFRYNTSLVRPAGAPLKTFGGTASGPEALIEAVQDIAAVLNARAGLDVRPVDALDCANIIGRCVVAGSARRSAELALGSFDDADFTAAKNWGAGVVPGWRANSNNTAIANDFEDIPDWYWSQGWDGSQELLGLCNMKAAKTYGRMGEYLADDHIVAANPCHESFLEDKEACNLASIALPRIESLAELLDISRLLYRVQKHVALLSHPSPETEAVMHRNTRLGQSLSGILDATDEQRSWVSPAYSALRDYDAAYSVHLGVRPSIRLTAVKPDGTIGLLFGTSPGIHGNWSHTYLRRVRIGNHSPLLADLRSRGYTVVPDRDLAGTESLTQSVVEFPVRLPEHSVTADRLSAVEQLEWVKWAQTVWADQAVSVTVTYSDEEVKGIRSWMQANWRYLKCVSWLRRADHGFKLAPYETISVERYLSEATRLETASKKFVEAALVEDLADECLNGACPIR